MSSLPDASRSWVRSCLAVVLLIASLLLGASVAHAYERTFPVDWSPPNDPGPRAFCRRHRALAELVTASRRIHRTSATSM
ncbi:hypothetical protein ACFJIX_17330 [Roseateles sp. UC29_93]|uniref:hypothetical protein n=1 Tax=Roseateles sp. UC29_93 TaxID=3350177 RepID=UPI0036724BAA